MIIKTIIRLRIPAQSAVMGPPLGPTLGQFGVAAMDFIKKFNELSLTYKKGTILSTIVYVFLNRTYKIQIIGPTISFLLKGMYQVKKNPPTLKLFNNKRLLITNNMLCEFFIFMRKNSQVVNFFSSFFIKSFKGFIKSLSILYTQNTY